MADSIEIWKTINLILDPVENLTINLEISNFGKIRKQYTEFYYTLNLNRKRLVIRVHIRNNTIRKFDAAKLVYETFKEKKLEKGIVPYFKDGNSRNINITNLYLDHPNFLRYLKQIKRDIKIWLKSYDEKDFVSIRHFSKKSDIPAHKIERYIKAIKRNMQIAPKEKINFYNLCRKFTNKSLTLKLNKSKFIRKKIKFTSKICHFIINDKTVCLPNKIFSKYEKDITKVTCKRCKKKYEILKICEIKLQSDFPNEKWKDLEEIPHLKIEISNFGRFRNKNNLKIYKLAKISKLSKRLYFTVKRINERIKLDAGNMVYKYFVNKKNISKVYFLDKNPENLYYLNLTIDKPVHHHKLLSNNIIKNDIFKWKNKYNPENFNTVTCFAKCSGISIDKIRRRIKHMKEELGISKNYKIELYSLVVRYLNIGDLVTNQSMMF